MMTRVKGLTVDKLRTLISSTVKDALEDFVEDLLALTSEKYLTPSRKQEETTKKAE